MRIRAASPFLRQRAIDRERPSARDAALCASWRTSSSEKKCSTLKRGDSRRPKMEGQPRGKGERVKKQNRRQGKQHTDRR